MLVCNTPALVKQGDTYEAAEELDPWFVTGLAEGEGCFCASIAVRGKMRTGLEVRPSFALSLNERDQGLLEDLRTFFECGWIRESRSDRTYKYEVRSIGELMDGIVPHFDAYPLMGAKAEAYAGFRAICQMIVQGDHLTLSGMREIVRISYRMNLGKRRRSKRELLRVLDEVKG
jgi:hypothetical protein